MLLIETLYSLLLINNGAILGKVTLSLNFMSAIYWVRRFSDPFFLSSIFVGQGLDTIGSFNNATLRGLQSFQNVLSNVTVMDIISNNSSLMQFILR